MPAWNSYPTTYRQGEVEAIAAAARAGESTAVIGLSGSGKSNLLGFIANRLGQSGALPHVAAPHPYFILVDCNRLSQVSLPAFFALLCQALGQGDQADLPSFAALEQAVQLNLEQGEKVCLLLDRFDSLAGSDFAAIASNLRALRDAFKYELSYTLATRRPLQEHNELSELFYAHTLWLGPLSSQDARWSVQRYTRRGQLSWDEAVIDRLIELTWGYPSFLRAACEAYAAGGALDTASLAAQPAVQQRVTEFLADQPGLAELEASGLAGHPWLTVHAAQAVPDLAQLTAKEHLLWQHFESHAGEVCEKDDLIRAVWPEDRIYEKGIRDDSLAQLVRRLREKIEAEPSKPQHIHTVPGRGYRFTP